VGASITDTRGVLLGCLACGVLAAGCQPDLGAPSSLVDAPRLLAVSATPAEAAPGSPVSYSVLIVDSDLVTFPSGEPPAAPVDWAFCNQEKPLSDVADVSAYCFTYDTESFLTEIGQGLAVSSRLPSQGCSTFGPDVPQPMMGMPAGRPTDPDPTGGYYQPVRLILPTSNPLVSILGAEESRISCGLSGASGATAAEFSMQYKANTNPVLAGLGLVPAASAPVTPIPPDDVTSPGVPVTAGARIVLQASWPLCAGSPAQACGAETYAYYDPATQMLTMQREALTVSWFATAGSYDGDTTTITPDDGATTADNGWTAPTAKGPVLLWLVLRDDRGGAAWQRYRLDVR
jgi:hypothetical protein